MFTATCSHCGKECQIPFEPKNARPVYCNECFQIHKPQERSGSKFTNHKNVVVALDLVEDRAMVEMTEVLDLVEVQEATEQERCLPRPVVTVGKNAKYHSNQKAADLSIATNVSKITNKIRNCFE